MNRRPWHEEALIAWTSCPESLPYQKMDGLVSNPFFLWYDAGHFRLFLVWQWLRTIVTFLRDAFQMCFTEATEAHYFPQKLSSTHRNWVWPTETNSNPVGWTWFLHKKVSLCSFRSVLVWHGLRTSLSLLQASLWPLHRWIWDKPSSAKSEIYQ